MLQTIEALRKSRQENSITQQLLGEVTGLHTSAITRIESGKIDCRASTLELLSDGIDTIIKNKHHSVYGVIVLDKTLFENVVYGSILEECEGMEHEGKYKGNGHHLAQRLCNLISSRFAGE